MRAKTWAVLFASLALSIGSVAFWRSRPPPQPATALPAEPAQQIERGSAPQGPAALQDAPAEPQRAPAARSTSPTVAARRVDRQRADALRRQIAEESARAAPAPDTSFALRSESSAAPPPAAAQPTEAEAERRRSYIRRALQEQYIPVARSCYEELLGRQPTAAGKVVLFFSILGVADAGVVNDVETRDGTTLEDPEFSQCMRESMYSTVFEAPPPGARQTTVQYPLELSP